MVGHVSTNASRVLLLKIQYEGICFWLAMVVRKVMRASRRLEEVGDEAVEEVVREEQEAVREEQEVVQEDALERDGGTARI